MIISHKYKYIFLKTSKTAGTSIEIALSKFCGNEDIITPILPEDEDVRQKLKYKGPQNYLDPDGNNVLYYNHISAGEIISSIGDTVWNSYFKFCFERNPFERVISQYFFHCRTEPRPSIMEFIVSSAPPALHKRGYQLYTISKEIVVDSLLQNPLTGSINEVIKRSFPKPSRH